jgi:uncharacterized protein
MWREVDFEWDVKKAIANFQKHGVSFEEASTIFVDPDGLRVRPWPYREI